jgi:hypothetical protein
MNTIEEAKAAAHDAKQEGLLGKYPMSAIILAAELDRIADEERCCCPEYVGFREYIKNLKIIAGLFDDAIRTGQLPKKQSELHRTIRDMAAMPNAVREPSRTHDTQQPET